MMTSHDDVMDFTYAGRRERNDVVAWEMEGGYPLAPCRLGGLDERHEFPGGILD